GPSACAVSDRGKTALYEPLFGPNSNSVVRTSLLELRSSSVAPPDVLVGRHGLHSGERQMWPVRRGTSVSRSDHVVPELVARVGLPGRSVLVGQRRGRCGSCFRLRSSSADQSASFLSTVAWQV